jgi:hypothetical protein
MAIRWEDYPKSQLSEFAAEVAVWNQADIYNERLTTGGKEVDIQPHMQPGPVQGHDRSVDIGHRVYLLQICHQFERRRHKYWKACPGEKVGVKIGRNYRPLGLESV